MICFIVGHGKSKSGGYDPGATYNGVHEFRIARQIARYAQRHYNDTYDEPAALLNDEADKYLTERIKYANDRKYDFVAEIHLNAGKGTGVEAYYHKGSDIGRTYADAVCKGIAKALGIPQRVNGVDDGGDKTKVNSAGRDYFAIVRETDMTSILIEAGFIDSTDIDKLKTEAGQRACGVAIADAVAKVRGVARKTAVEDAKSDKLFRVQIGAFSKRENAEALLKKAKEAGFGDAFIV